MINAILFQLPPLTPGTVSKVGEALKCTYSSWTEKSEEHSIPGDPREWTSDHVREWLSWTMVEFQFNLSEESFDKLIANFKVRDLNRVFFIKKPNI